MTRVLVVGVLFAVIGCGGDGRAPKLEQAHSDIEQPSTSEKDELDIKLCTDGQTQECKVTLSEHNGIVTCYVGVQSCVDGNWGECGGGEVVTQEATNEEPDYGLGLQSLGSQSNCLNNPCDPNCKTYVETPDAPFQAISEEGNFEWVEGLGGLGKYPKGLVKKGYQEPCEASEHCQFNMECQAPAKGTCEHSLCVEGALLEKGCNACTDRLCIDHPECCVPPESDDESSSDAACAHDLCTTGRGLEASCNWCVEAICEDMPECCDTTGLNANWTATCAAAVVGVCGGSCECGQGETAFGGSCYRHSEDAKPWDDAMSACESSPGWSLVTIDDAAENAMVAQIAPAQDKYIGLAEQSSQWRWVGDPDQGFFNAGSPPGTIYTNFAASEPVNKSRCAFVGSGSDRWLGETSCTSNAKRDRRGYVCEGPPSAAVLPAGPGAGISTMPSAVAKWDQHCIALAESECGVICNEDFPSDDSGICSRRLPGAVDETCDGVDLTVAIPCDGVIPVCNTGKTDSATGVTLVHFPANSQQMPNRAPNLSHPEMVTCVIDEPIPSGECLIVPADDCTDNKGNVQGLGGNREIMINPMSQPSEQVVSECDHYDNWSVYSHGAYECGVPECSGGQSSVSPEPVKIDIVFVIDNSVGMETQIAEFEDRINDIMLPVLDLRGVDFRVILLSRYGEVASPIGTSANPACVSSPLGATPCLDPLNEQLQDGTRFFHHSTDIEGWDSWCQVLGGFYAADEVGILDPAAFGSPAPRTWTTLHEDGWGSLLRPDTFKAFIMMGDDDVDCSDYGYDFDDSPDCEAFPHQCHDVATQVAFESSVAAGEAAAVDFDAALRAISPSVFGSASDRSYVWHSIVNVAPNTGSVAEGWAPSEAVQTQMCTAPGTAVAGAGTGQQALSKLTGGVRYPVCDASNIGTILGEVAEVVAEKANESCYYDLPDQGDELDPASAFAHYTLGDGTKIDLTQYPGASNCGTATKAWYHVSPELRQLALCPETCKLVKQDRNAKVWYRLGCPGGAAVPTTYAERYEAGCGIGELPQWTHFGYDTDTPGDSKVIFKVRTGNTPEELEAAPWVQVAQTSSTYPDCQIAPTAQPNCPVDLYTHLGAKESNRWLLDVEFDVVPGSDGSSPSVNEWKVNFSCPDGE